MGLKWDCPVDQTCSTWAFSYFSDCVCNRADMISLLLGIASIVCWGLAEIPQILNNWRSPTESVSLAFILTWMIGDIFNLAGCWINPATLPTQFYLAVLYSATTLLLVVQQLWSSWVSYKDSHEQPVDQTMLGNGRVDARAPRWHNDLEGLFPSDRALAQTPGTQSLPAKSKRSGRPPLPVTASLPVRPYSESSGSYTASVPVHVRGSTQSPGTYSGSWRRLTLSSSYGTSGSPVIRGLVFSSLSVVGITLSGLYLNGEGFMPHGGVIVMGGDRRRLLQDKDEKDIAQSVGLILGWLMTCIYLTGRLPQIILNWSRDFIIGVSVSTVVFAFLGNATYLGSILVRNITWAQLKPVLPWVVDITCCLLMDFSMMVQFLIHHRKEGYTTLD